MIETVVAVALLFPWSLMIMVVVGMTRRRGRQGPREYIAPQKNAPKMLDSAMLAKTLRDAELERRVEP